MLVQQAPCKTHAQQTCLDMTTTSPLENLAAILSVLQVEDLPQNRLEKSTKP
jgi:hypothetical protein